MKIESHQKIENEVGARYLKWSFGRTLSRNDLSVGYIMKVVFSFDFFFEKKEKSSHSNKNFNFNKIKKVYNTK